MEKREGKSNAQKRGRAGAVWVGQTCAPRVQEQRGLSGVPCVRWTRCILTLARHRTHCQDCLHFCGQVYPL